MKSYSLDLRECVLNYLSSSGNVTQASEIFEVGRTSIYRWLKKARLKGRPLDDPPKRPWKKINPEKLKALVYEHPDYRLKDFASHFGCRLTSIRQAFKILKITRKKRLCGIKKGTKTSVVYFWSL
jgi:putative transposase